MKKLSFLLFSLLSVIILYSCSSMAAQGQPAWLEHPESDQGNRLFSATVALAQPRANEILAAELRDQIWVSLGLDPLNPQDMESYEDLYLRILNLLEGGEDPELILLQDESYFLNDVEFRSVLIAYPESYLEEFAQEVMAWTAEVPQELQDIRDRVEMLAEQGHYGSAFILSLRAAAQGNNQGDHAGQGFMMQDLGRAEELLAMVEVEPLSGPVEWDSLSTDPWIFQYRFPLLEEEQETMLFQLKYRHPLDENKEAMALVWTDELGQLEFQHPRVIESGNYSLSIELDTDYILQILGTEELPRTGQGITEATHQTVDYRVIVDYDRLPLGIFVEDLDVLGNKNLRGETGALLRDALAQRQGEVSLIAAQAIDRDSITDLQFHRELKGQLPQGTAIVIMGQSRILDFQSQGRRSDLTCELNYQFLDLRSMTILEEGSFQKQIEAPDATQALAGLYNQMARELAQIFQGYVFER